MRITNWKYKGNRNIIISNDNIVSGRDQPSYNESYVRESKINGEAIENGKYRKKR